MIRRLHLILLRMVPSPILRMFEGFWLAPIVFASTGVLLALLIHLLPEKQVSAKWLNLLGSIDPDGARGTLSVLSGSMVSLVALVFSLTFVALSITAQQLSPRILDFVLRERSAQILLGLALTTLLFGAIMLTAGDIRGAWRLGLATPIALLLAAATLVMVVVFAHSMTRVMRAEDMVARLGDRFVDGVHSLLDPPPGCSEGVGNIEFLEREFSEGKLILAKNAGYVGIIDYEQLVRFAQANDLRIKLTVRESDFLLVATPIARVLGLHGEDEAPDGSIEAALNLTDRRDASDMAGYDAAALCETALRALSPGINDPATAISCLHRLFEGLSVLAAAEHPPPRMLGAKSDGVKPMAHVLRPSREVPEFIANTVKPVMAAAKGETRVLERIEKLANQVRSISHRARDRSAIDELLDAIVKARDAAG